MAKQDSKTGALDPEEAQSIAKYDLLTKMVPFLDRHLILNMLMFAAETGIYKPEDLYRAQNEVSKSTKLHDVYLETCTKLNIELPFDLEEAQEELEEQQKDLQHEVMPLLQIFEDKAKMTEVADKDFKSIFDFYEHCKVDHGLVDKIPAFARSLYDVGRYELSSSMLNFTLKLPIANTPIYSTCLWGALCSCILHGSFASAIEHIHKLDELLEKSEAPKRDILLHRTWLLHWTLFVIFKYKPNALPEVEVFANILSFFLSEKSLSIISLSCPHLFRYVGACLILQKRLKLLVKDTVWIIHHEVSSYSDPVTRFLLALYTEMDYDDAQKELANCEQVCRGDFFLEPHWPEFQENARLHIFESYCRIHQCINIDMIATKLNMQAEEAELWIVKLIQNAKLDARIDSEKKRVVMTKAPPNVYQQVIEKTKNLAFRSTMLVSNLEKAT